MLEIRRETTHQKGIIKSVSQKLAGPKTIIQEGDIVYLIGEREQAMRFAADYSLDISEKFQQKVMIDMKRLTFMI